MSGNSQGFAGGLEIGSVSVKWVHSAADGTPLARVYRHEGNPKGIICDLIDEHRSENGGAIVATGQPVPYRQNIHYRTELECLEKALDHLQL